MRVAVLVHQGSFDTGLSTLLDAFELANALAGGRKRALQVSRVGTRRRVKTGLGLTLPLEAPPRRAPDLAIVPALGAKTMEGIAVELAGPEVRRTTALLRKWSAAGTRIAAACTGTFVLGASGLLDGRLATTTWWLANGFRARFPAVRLDESRMLVDAGRVITAGAALGHLDLALWVVHRHSPALARLTERHLTFDRGRTQGAYVLPDHMAHGDAMVERFVTWARAHLADFSLAAAGRAVGASERTLQRRVAQVLGRSPLSYLQDLRVDAARRQLESTDRSIEEIAASVGYQDGVTLRTLLRKRTGLGVRQLRRRDPGAAAR
jgi:transcriptional regulator GlxA family with amidase domain